jgi:hypothetical protein
MALSAYLPRALRDRESAELYLSSAVPSSRAAPIAAAHRLYLSLLRSKLGIWIRSVKETKSGKAVYLTRLTEPRSSEEPHTYDIHPSAAFPAISFLLQAKPYFCWASTQDLNLHSS